MNKTAIYILVCFLFGSIASAQTPAVPSAPQRYYQPVKIQCPAGAKIAFAAGGQFVERKTAPYAAGLLVGADYRTKITNIPNEPGKEVFPTVKVIDRTYPPAGQALKFPIVIEITQEDIELALDGKFVTRVIYLEDPRKALPVRGDTGSQLTTDIKSGDPINQAAMLGIPVAVLYLGGRVPNSLQNDAVFFHGCPPWAEITKTPAGRYEIAFH
ncbi:MAG: hypothetical protein LBN39_03985 [Planctomycetaceae bacterium]|jgi:hypothetical protein|nr:hypothetical protein [Planctomycetaceae bacterium]